MYSSDTKKADKETQVNSASQKKSASSALSLPAVPALQLKEEASANKVLQREETEDEVEEQQPLVQDEEDTGEEEGNSSVDEAIAQLLTYATEDELDAMLSGEPGMQESDEKESSDVPNGQPVQLTKQTPKHTDRYNQTHDYSGRTFYHRYSNSKKRTKKFSGPIVYVKGGRKGTPKVPYKRKTDAAGHLIAHSFGGPPKYLGNFVAMNKLVNSAGGDWGKMEAYIRKRLKAKSTTAYMSVTPIYPNDKSKRPTSIKVTAHFNRDPKRVQWLILTP